MPLNSTQTAEDADGAVDYLLLSTPNLIARNRVLLQLHVVGIACDESPLGIRIGCRDLDWHVLLEAIAVDLSEAERAETRVAVLRQSDDPQALHRTIFRACALNALLDDLQNRWFDEILKRDGGIAVHLQPLLQYPPGRVHGYECLMRGVDAEGAVVCPTRMFEVARKLGRLEELDERCRDAAVHAAAKVRGAGLTFFINFIPGASPNARRSLAALMGQLQAAGLKAGQVALEVVETEKVHDRRELMHVLRCYRKVGFKIALDDVGAGYSSLLSVSKVRPDYIKLDGELVRRAAGGALEAKIVADLAETARQNGIVTIAEGIETADQFHLVAGCGIRIMQGYWLAGPRSKILNHNELRHIVQRMRAARESDPSAWSLRPLRPAV